MTPDQLEKWAKEILERLSEGETLDEDHMGMVEVVRLIEKYRESKVTIRNLRQANRNLQADLRGAEKLLERYRPPQKFGSGHGEPISLKDHGEQ